MDTNETTAIAEAGPNAVHLVVLTGMSGGGKTVALRALEDLEFYCVDNLPASLLPRLVNAVLEDRGGRRMMRIAVGVDARNREHDIEIMPSVLSELAEAGVQVHLLFLDCRDEVLIKRYSETRRRHPLAMRNVSLADAIAAERRLLRPLMGIAEKVIDSSQLNVHQLRRLVATDYARATEGLTVMFQSFAFKRGLPLDADFVFDARCLPNPHWQPALRPLTGRDAAVAEFLAADQRVTRMFEQISAFLEEWIPCFAAEGRSYLTVALGCTGGQHRSVYLAERIAAHLNARGHSALTDHRELP